MPSRTKAKLQPAVTKFLKFTLDTLHQMQALTHKPLDYIARPVPEIPISQDDQTAAASFETSEREIFREQVVKNARPLYSEASREARACSDHTAVGHIETLYDELIKIVRDFVDWPVGESVDDHLQDSNHFLHLCEYGAAGKKKEEPQLVQHAAILDVTVQEAALPYIRQHPKANLTEIAKMCGVARNTIYKNRAGEWTDVLLALKSGPKYVTGSVSSGSRYDGNLDGADETSSKFSDYTAVDEELDGRK